MEYNELFLKLNPTIRRIAARLVRRSDVVLGADDLYQEACLYLWRTFETGTLRDKTDSYILQGCYFHLKNYLRTHGRRAVVYSLDAPLYSDEGGLFSYEPPSPEPDCRDQLHARFLVEQLCNNGFTQREKDVLLLWRDALDTRQIGRRLGISHVRVVKLMAGIRRKSARHIDYL